MLSTTALLPLDVGGDTLQSSGIVFTNFVSSISFSLISSALSSILLVSRPEDEDTSDSLDLRSIFLSNSAVRISSLLEYIFKKSSIKKKYSPYFGVVASISLGGATKDCLARVRAGGVGEGKMVGKEDLTSGGKLK